MPENISERVKELRTEQGMTLAELGEKAKLSTSYLLQIERDKTSPSLSTLMSIARALNVELCYFLEIETEPAYIKRADRGKDSHASSSPIVRLHLTPKVGSNKLETYRVILQPHAVPEWLDLFSGEEFGFVLIGELTIRVGEEQFVLAAGDSIHLDAYQPRYWSNAGDEPCVVIWGRAASLNDY